VQAVVITAPGEAGNIRLVEQPEPVPGAGELVIEIACAGCNWGDTMLVRGTYPHPIPYPFVPGWEVAGRISFVGPGVEPFRIGERVAAYLPDGGGYAERCIARAEDVMKLPETASFEIGAAFPVQALTAWHVLHTVGGIRAGDTVLIHAIGGGLGLYATQFAVAAGARVIGTYFTPGKDRKARELGAVRLVDRNEEDFVAASLDLTGGAGVDLVLDSLGAATLDRSFDALRPLGRAVSIGEAEGPPLPSLWQRLIPKSLTFSRFHLGHVARTNPAWQAGVTDVLGGLADGRYVAPIETAYPLAAAARALDRLLSRDVAGKLLLRA
jgi:NADPH2:quinone reductase